MNDQFELENGLINNCNKFLQLSYGLVLLPLEWIIYISRSLHLLFFGNLWQGHNSTDCNSMFIQSIDWKLIDELNLV